MQTRKVCVNIKILSLEYGMEFVGHYWNIYYMYHVAPSSFSNEGSAIDPSHKSPKRTSPISYNALLCHRNVHACAHFCDKGLHWGIHVWWIVGFARWIYWRLITNLQINCTVWDDLTEYRFGSLSSARYGDMLLSIRSGWNKYQIW